MTQGIDATKLTLMLNELRLPTIKQLWPCLLYTSDAADERSSVDLGGRRIIKKKNIQRRHSRARREQRE